MAREQMLAVRRHYKTGGTTDLASEKFTCENDDCKTRVFDNIPEATAHHVAHLFQDQAKNLASAVQETVRPLIERSAGQTEPIDLTPVAEAITGLKRHSEAVGAMVSDSLLNFDPVHAHVTEVMAEAERCATCKATLEELETRAVAKKAPKSFVTREDPLNELLGTRAKPAGINGLAAKKPDTTKLLEVPDDDVDYFALSAHGIEAEPTENGRVRFLVKDKESAQVAIEEGNLLPEKCRVAVGPDGKTEYICEAAGD